MVCLVSFGNLDLGQRRTQPAILDLWPRPPLALKSCVTMLDSCGMPESEDKPPTLASLRRKARKGSLWKTANFSFAGTLIRLARRDFSPLSRRPLHRSATR